MNQYNEISTLQYMGSKARIISHICDPIIKNKSIETVVDLFAGTGSVGYALKSYKNIISNDIEHYAYIINQAILCCKVAIFPTMIILCQREKVFITCFCSSWRKSLVMRISAKK